MGYLPEAVVNYLVRLGWSHGDQEIFSQEELVKHFSLEKVGKTPAVFDPVKLEWLNGQYIKHVAPDRLTALLRPLWEAAGVSQQELFQRDEAWLHRVACLFQERARTVTELASSSRFVFDGKIERDKADGTALGVTATPSGSLRERLGSSRSRSAPLTTHSPETWRG